MKELRELESELAGVVSLQDMAGDVLDRIQRLAAASGATLFAFDHENDPTVFGGSLADAMRGYTADLFQEDLFQAYNLTFPKTTFRTWDQGGFDLGAHLRSRPYVDFYRPRDMGFLQALWPTGRSYGSNGMFGLLLSTPKFYQRFDAATCRMLDQLELPMRSAARRIARFSALESERDILRHLLGTAGGAFVLWDSELKLVWVSPGAKTHLQGGLPGEGLARAAAIASRQLQRAAKSQSETRILGRPQRVTVARGGQVVAEFCSIRASRNRPWLLAELSSSQGIHAQLATLTSAESRVLRLLVRGLSNREICDELFVSHDTVKTHVRRILRKLDVGSRSKAASLARDAWRK